MDAFRKQLDQLMGANRNGDVTEVKRNYWERDVCRQFLCGLCPHDLFQLTKMDLGQCPQLHSLELKKLYEEARAKGKDDYDRELEESLEKHVVECDRKIERALKRLKDDQEDGAVAIAVSEVTKSAESDELTVQINEKMKEAEQLEMDGKTDDKIRVMDVVEELRQKRADRQAISLLEAFNKDRLNAPPPSAPSQPPAYPGAFPGTQIVTPPPDARTQEMITEKLKRAEELGEQGRVDEAQKAMEEAEALKKLGSRPDPAQMLPTPGGNIQIADQKLRVCDICGAFLSIYDSDRRLADHFGGKLHLGYMQIRDKLKELKEARRAAALARKPAGVLGEDEKGLDGAAKIPRSEDRERDAPRSRDSHRDSEREHRGRSDRERDRDRDGERERDRDRDRDRSRDRERDRDRGRSRHGDRDRERDRDRGDRRDRERDVEKVSRSVSRERSRDRGDRHREDRHRSDRHRDRDRDRDRDRH